MLICVGAEIDCTSLFNVVLYMSDSTTVTGNFMIAVIIINLSSVDLLCENFTLNVAHWLCYTCTCSKMSYILS